jgi:RNA polymerase sigma-70 factor (ECF subfamily)
MNPLSSPVIKYVVVTTNILTRPWLISQKEICLRVINWQVIVKNYGPLVWQTAYRLLANHTDAADCFQETFVSALEFSRRQRVRNFPALLSRLATARAIDRLRQRSRQPLANIEDADWVAISSANPGPVQQAQQHELAARLRKTLAQLPSQEAQVFCLRYLNNMSYRQIAKELDIKTSAAGVLLHRARAKLREHFASPLDESQKDEVKV